jgi:hypothetical protein
MPLLGRETEGIWIRALVKMRQFLGQYGKSFNHSNHVLVLDLTNVEASGCGNVAGRRWEIAASAVFESRISSIKQGIERQENQEIKSVQS